MESLSTPLVYAVQHKSPRVRSVSSSGGAYTAISDYALQNSFVLYGVEFGENFTVEHSRATTRSQRDRFRGSKYVKSDLGDTFLQVSKDLKYGRRVLFTGTPCEVDGLRRFLKHSENNTEELVLCDLVCHGTASPLLWRNYIDFIQREGKLISYSFRAKEKGWRGYNVRMEMEHDQIKLNTPDARIFARIYSSDLALRPSCYFCRFASLERPSDLTIGDFWGIEKSIPEMNDDKGTSLVLVNTKKGQEVFGSLSDSVYFLQSSVKDCLQPNLCRPTPLPNAREKFWSDYRSRGFGYIAKRYGGYSIQARGKTVVRNMLDYMGLLAVLERIMRRSNQV